MKTTGAGLKSPHAVAEMIVVDEIAGMTTMMIVGGGAASVRAGS